MSCCTVFNLPDVLAPEWLLGIAHLMADMTFNTYEEAASYARRRARESGSSVGMGWRNEQWVVHDPATTPQRIEKSDYQSSPPVRVILHGYPWESWGSGGPATAQEILEREQRQAEYADQKAYEEAIRANTPRVKEAVCEACDRPISRCRCSS